MKPEKNKTFLQRLIDAGVEAANYEDPTYIRQAERHLRNGEVEAANTDVKAGLLGTVAGAALAAPIIASTPAAAMSAPQFFAYSQMQALPTATRIASKVVPFLGSIVGGHAVNEASQALTDKTFGENVYDTVSQALPNYVQNNKHVQAWGPVISEFLNPGYIAGGWATSKLPSTVSDIATNIAAKRAAAPKTSPKIEYSNWGGEFVDDVAVNSRQQYLPKPSKLSEAERLGIPKHIRTNKFKYPKAGLSTDANVYMVHRSDDVWPVEGDMIRFKMGRPYDVTVEHELTAETIAKHPEWYPEGTMPYKEEEVFTKYPFSMHFTHGDEVASHMQGDWGGRKVTYLVPYKDIVAKNGAPYSVEPYDTFWTAGTTFGFDKKGVKALTFDKPTYLKLKSRGIDVEFSPEAVKHDFRKAWIKQKSIDAGMPVTKNPQVFTPPSELHKMAKDANDLYWIKTATKETLPWVESAPKAHSGHWTYGLHHTKGNVLEQTRLRNSVLHELQSRANSDIYGETSPVTIYKHNSRLLDFPTLQSGIKWLGLRDSQLEPWYRETPYGKALETKINKILSGEELIKYRKGGKL